ncbi:MAG: type I-E CRISPR-associated protein Cas6/Cse3/CasE [Chloroflexota bacterium]
MTQFYLSKLILNPLSAQVRSEMRNPYQLHRTLTTRVFDSSRNNAKALHRVDSDYRTGKIILLLQSQTAPNLVTLEQADNGRYLNVLPQSKQINITPQRDQIYRFRLVANPSVKRDGKRHSYDKRDKPNGKTKDERYFHWIKTKGEGCTEIGRPSNGFKVLQVDFRDRGAKTDKIFAQAKADRPERNHKLKFQAVQYDGILQVTDPTLFSQALINGIGPSKAFGCGLLSLAPV